jgi:hypothetical protein
MTFGTSHHARQEISMRKTLTLVSGLVLSTGVAFAQSMDHSNMDHGDMKMD